MSNKDYENNKKELQLYTGSLDNTSEESGNTSESGNIIDEERGNVVEENEEYSSEANYNSQANTSVTEKESGKAFKFYVFFILIIFCIAFLINDAYNKQTPKTDTEKINIENHYKMKEPELVKNVSIKHDFDLKATGYHNIHSAIDKNDFNTVKLFVEAGEAIDKRDDYGRTPLYTAVSNHNYKIAEYLIKNGALLGERLEDCNKFENILYFPVRYHKYKMVNLLVNNGILVGEDLKLYTNDRKVLRFIESKGKINIDDDYEVDSKYKEWEEAYNFIKEGKLNELIKLEDKGKDLSKMYYDGKPAICIAIEFKRNEIVEHLVKKYDCRKQIDLITGRNALHYAAMNIPNDVMSISNPNIYKIRELLIENGFDPNELDYDNNTPLNLACINNQAFTMHYLLTKGANPNILNKKQQNSLFFFIHDCDSYAIKKIIKEGANINQQDIYGNTPLHQYLLVHNYDFSCFKEFLNCGADIKLVNVKKQSPLHIAVLTCNSGAVKALLENGADINLQDIDGKTPLDYAVNKNFTEIIKLMEEYKNN